MREVGHNIHPAVEEAVDTLGLPNRTRRHLLGAGGLFSASLAASALLTACGSPQEKSATGIGNFPETPRWKFVFVNHVTTNPFFVPTRYGAEDACKLLGCDYQWAGSEGSKPREMVSALQSAISANANGIALAVTDIRAFTELVDNALDKGIPVVSYNADGEVGKPGTNRLAYIGQDLYVSGQQVGERIASLVQGSGTVAGFIATLGQSNIQPRIDGAKDAIEKSGKQLKVEVIETGADLPGELSKIDAYVQGHPDVKAMFAVDAGSTQMLGQVMEKYKLKDKGIAAGGFDLVEATLKSIKAGHLDFTIDQQPYLQGFLPVLYLYLWKLSGGLVAPVNTETGLSFITKDNVDPYLGTKSRYEGSAKAPQLIKREGAISHG